MSHNYEPQASGSGSGGSKPRKMPQKSLRRGTACLNCRFLKIRCDAVKPICGPCADHPKEDPCEYQDAKVRSRYQHLEDTIKDLQERLAEHESPQKTNPSVVLQNPYGAGQVPGPSISTAASSRQQPGPSSAGPYTPISPFSTDLSLEGSPADTPAMLSVPTTPNVNDASMMMARSLLDSFHPHASSFGFFLDPVPFYRCILHPRSPMPDDPDHGCPTPYPAGVVSTAYLVGAHVSSHLRSRERGLLAQALADTATTTAIVDRAGDGGEGLGVRVEHAVQAEIVLAYYFWRTGHLFEARRHSGAASALVLSAGFHLLQHAHHQQGPVGVDRLRAFWAAFVLEECLSLAGEGDQYSTQTMSGAFHNLTVAGQIMAAWPPATLSSTQGHVLAPEGMSSPPPGSNAIQNFIAGREPPVTPADSGLALIAKACVLLSWTKRIQSQMHPNMSPNQYQSWLTSVHSLHRLVAAFLTGLLPHQPSTAELGTIDGQVYLAYALGSAAGMRLNRLFVNTSVEARLAAAQSAAEVFAPGWTAGQHQQQGMGVVNPVLGTVWTMAREVLSGEMSRSQSPTHPPTPTHPQQQLELQQQQRELSDALRRGIWFTENFSTTRPLQAGSAAAMLAQAPVQAHEGMSDAYGGVGMAAPAPAVSGQREGYDDVRSRHPGYGYEYGQSYSLQSSPELYHQQVQRPSSFSRDAQYTRKQHQRSRSGGSSTDGYDTSPSRQGSYHPYYPNSITMSSSTSYPQFSYPTPP